MKYSIKKVCTQLFAFVSLVFVSQSLLAGGPLEVCNSGQPHAWANGGANVPFNPDAGNLGILDGPQATQAVTDAFQAWADVPTASITYQNNGQLAEDVNITNFGPFLQPAAPDGLSAIVFDDNGEIFDALFGAGSGILGFAGPEFLDDNSCTILEGVSFLNGPAIGSLEGLLDLMVHEFGHYSNLAHTEVNGQIFIGVGDSSGPGTDNTFGDPPFPDGVEVIATMYPFLFGGIDQLARTPSADDQAILSTIYPEPSFFANSGSISGTIFSGNNKVTGVNVIARNVDNPFEDAVSAISSDFTRDYSQGNSFTGAYTINGLTPGANYAVYVDEILDGGFSTPLSTPLPGPEEFYNGANESSDGIADVPTEFTAITVSAGTEVTDIDILFNIPPPNSPLATGDDGNVEIPLPFDFCVAGKPYSSVNINGNGFLTLGAADTVLTFIESSASLLSGPPRVAGFWDDLSPNEGGSVSYDQSGNTFTVTWDAVPEFLIGGSNTFSITLKDNSRSCVSKSGDDDDDDDDDDYDDDYGDDDDDGYEDDDDDDHYNQNNFSGDIKITHNDISSIDGLVGVSGGAFSTSGFETEVDLTVISRNGRKAISLKKDAAVYELFSDSDVDIANTSFIFKDVGKAYKDRFEKNNSLKKAKKIELPFDSIDTKRAYTSIDPAADDIDFFRFKYKLEAGTTLVAEVLTGQVDTVMGLYKCDESTKKYSRDRSKRCNPDTAELVAFNDDSNGLLSRIVYEIPTDGSYALAITFCCDFDFDGVDPGQGGALDEGRYVLEAFVIDGVLLELGDEATTEVALDFTFPYQGIDYNSVFVNSNGYLTLGGGETGNFTPSVTDLETGLPRVAPLWIDLDPGSGGMIVSSSDSGSQTISYMGVPEFFFGGANTFSVTLDSSGGISLGYADLSAPDGIAGLGAGDGNPSTAVDLSTSSNWPANGSTYEQFIFGLSEVDLAGTTIQFDP